MHRFATDALVLGQTMYGEADKIVTLFTKLRGKVSAIAHGARLSRKRFGAALAPFVLGEALLTEKRNADLLVLGSFAAQRDFSALGLGVGRLAHAMYVTELTRELVAPHQVEPAVFDLLVEAYEILSTSEPRADTLRAFELSLLKKLGLAPVFDRCVRCGRKELPRALVFQDCGGLVCEDCTSNHDARPGKIVGEEAQERLRLLQRLTSILEVTTLPPAPSEVATTVREGLHTILNAHLKAPLRSVEFIEKLRGD